MSVATCTGGRPANSNRPPRTGSSSWPTTTTPGARVIGPWSTPCGQPRRPAPNTPSRWLPPTTWWPNAGPPAPLALPQARAPLALPQARAPLALPQARAPLGSGRALPRGSATCSCSRAATAKPSPAWRRRWHSRPTGWPVSPWRASSATSPSSGATRWPPAPGWRGRSVTWAAGPPGALLPSWSASCGKSSCRPPTASSPTCATAADRAAARRTSSPSASTAAWPTCTGSTAGR